MTSNHLIVKKRVALAVTLVVHVNVSGSPGHILLHTRSCGDCCIVAVLCYALHYFVNNYYLNILDAETEKFVSIPAQNHRYYYSDAYMFVRPLALINGSFTFRDIAALVIKKTLLNVYCYKFITELLMVCLCKHMKLLHLAPPAQAH